MADEQVDQEELRNLETELRKDEELREQRLHEVIRTAFQKAANHVVASLRTQQEGELTIHDAIYAACRETGDRIVGSLRILMGVLVVIGLLIAGTTYYTTDRALTLATERARVLVVGEKDGNGVFHPGLATSVAQQMEMVMKGQRESLVRELEGMQESHEQTLKELLQPVRPAPTRAPQNQPSTIVPATPTPPTRPATERNWSTIGR